MVYTVDEAFAFERGNPFGGWNRSAASSVRSENQTDAANRIYDSYAEIHPPLPGFQLKRGSPIFAMGSCFAREIEAVLMAAGGVVVSMDRQKISTPCFFDGGERGFRMGFFNRFTPRSMLQEFQRCFDELPQWSDDSLLFERSKDTFVDMNYWTISGMPLTLEASMQRRAVARDLVRRASEAEVIILTLGLTEGWIHKKTGLYANRIDPKVVFRNREEFEFQLIDYAETIECLAGIQSLLKRHHKTGKFSMVVTVSPVPLQATFTGRDIVVANMDSKATLRAAAAAFCRDYAAEYFPSYEMVAYTNHNLAWKPDRVHVQPDMVRHIVETFTRTYYENGALGS